MRQKALTLATRTAGSGQLRTAGSACRFAPAPWADFETDKFMLNVPSSWVSSYADPAPLLQRYDAAMDATAESEATKERTPRGAVSFA